LPNINQIYSRSDIHHKINDLYLKKENSVEDCISNEHYRSIINPENEANLKNCQNKLNNEYNLTPIERIDLLEKQKRWLLKNN
jgi:hypothetical protein